MCGICIDSHGSAWHPGWCRNHQSIHHDLRFRKVPWKWSAHCQCICDPTLGWRKCWRNAWSWRSWPFPCRGNDQCGKSIIDIIDMWALSNVWCTRMGIARFLPLPPWIMHQAHVPIHWNSRYPYQKAFQQWVDWHHHESKPPSSHPWPLE